MKTAFVLSGGGAKGCFQVGVMKKLFEQEIIPDVLYGTSVGALNSAGYAYQGIGALWNTWASIKGNGDILSSNIYKIFCATGLYSMSPIRKNLINPLISGNPLREAVVCRVSLLSGEVQFVSNKDSKVMIGQFRDAVEGSAAMPGFMEPVNGEWVDGGVRHQTPLKKAIEDGADRIVAILCNPITENMESDISPWSPSWPKVATNGLRAVDIMSHEIFLHDIRQCLRYNNDPSKKKIDLKVYAPSKLLIDTLEFNPTKIRLGLDQGYNLPL